jgi:hypothetical protein
MLACKKGADVRNQNSIQRLNPSETQYVSGGFSPSKFKKQLSITTYSLALSAITASFLWLTQEIPFIRSVSKFISNGVSGFVAGYVCYKIKSNKKTD